MKQRVASSSDTSVTALKPKIKRHTSTEAMLLFYIYRNIMARAASVI
jgi:hypothetical protein